MSYHRHAISKFPLTSQRNSGEVWLLRRETVTPALPALCQVIGRLMADGDRQQNVGTERAVVSRAGGWHGHKASSVHMGLAAL